MPDQSTDAVIGVMRYAYTMTSANTLTDMDAALYAAAFALYGPGPAHLVFATEASYYFVEASGDYVSAVCLAIKRRMSAGVLGSKASTVEI